MQAETGSLNAIYAVGPVSSSGTLQTHSLNAAAVISPQVGLHGLYVPSGISAPPAAVCRASCPAFALCQAMFRLLPVTWSGQSRLRCSRLPSSLSTGPASACVVHAMQAATVSTGQGQGEGDSSGGGSNPQMLAAHGWIAVIGLGFLTPLGITIAKLGSHTRTWKGLFWLHIIAQVLPQGRNDLRGVDSGHHSCEAV